MAARQGRYDLHESAASAALAPLQSPNPMATMKILAGLDDADEPEGHWHGGQQGGGEA